MIHQERWLPFVDSDWSLLGLCCQRQQCLWNTGSAELQTLGHGFGPSLQEGAWLSPHDTVTVTSFTKFLACCDASEGDELFKEEDFLFIHVQSDKPSLKLFRGNRWALLCFL